MLAQMAISGGLQERALDTDQAFGILRSVASANMLASPQRRVFSAKDAAKAAGGQEAWASLAGAQGGFPLIKTLEEGAQPYLYLLLSVSPCNGKHDLLQTNSCMVVSAQVRREPRHSTSFDISASRSLSSHTIAKRSRISFGNRTNRLVPA